MSEKIIQLNEGIIKDEFKYNTEQKIVEVAGLKCGGQPGEYPTVLAGTIFYAGHKIIKDELKELVRSSVEETLNGLLDKEAEELVNAGKYERTAGREGYRAGHYDRNVTTTSGEVTLKMPKLKGVAFETAIIERYRRRESSVFAELKILRKQNEEPKSLLQPSAS